MSWLLAFINWDLFQPSFLLQMIQNGVLNGLIYGSFALTVVIIFRTTSHLNFAQGEMAMFCTFVTVVAQQEWGLPLYLAGLVGILFGFVLGAAIERFLVRPLEHKSPLAVVIVGLGLFLIFNALALEIWGGAGAAGPRVLQFPLSDPIDDLWVVMQGPPRFFVKFTSLIILASVLVMLFVLYVLLQRTKLGLAYRAVASNRDSAQLVGIPVNRMLMFGWGLAGAIGSVAAVLFAGSGAQVEPNMMAGVLLYGFAAACLGGFDSPPGAVIGGLIVGLSESLIPRLFTFSAERTQLSLVVALALILVVLIVRPQGLFGSKRVERV